MSHPNSERVAQIIAEERARKRRAAIEALHKVASATPRSDFTRSGVKEWWK